VGRAGHRNRKRERQLILITAINTRKATPDNQEQPPTPTFDNQQPC